MNDDLIISMLALAGRLSASDFLVIDIPDAESETGYATRKVTTQELFMYFLTQVLYTSQLNTDVKTVIGAINEVKSAAATAATKAGNAEDTTNAMVDDVKALESAQYYQDGDEVSLTDAIVNGFIEDGIYKIFIPLQKPVFSGLVPVFSGTWNVRGATSHNVETLATLGTVQTFIQEQGITVLVDSQESEEGIVQFESINAKITFEEEQPND